MNARPPSGQRKALAAKSPRRFNEVKQAYALGEDAPSALEELTSMILKTGKEESSGSTTQVSLRVPLEDMAMIEALAKESELPRAQMMLKLVEVGVEALYETLPQEVLGRVHDYYGEYLGIPAGALDALWEQIRSHERKLVAKKHPGKS